MSKIGELLNFNFSADTYSLQANTVVSPANYRLVEKAAESAEALALRLGDFDAKAPDNKLLDEVVKKFKLHPNDSGLFSLRDLRMLTYALDNFDGENKLPSLIRMLESRWRNSFVNGIVVSLISRWSTYDKAQKKLIIDLLTKRLSNYDGTRKRLLEIKQNLRYFTDNGPAILGKELASNNSQIQLLQAPTKIGFSEEKLSFEYFSDTIVAYYDTRGYRGEVLNVAKILATHNNDLTNKRVIPRLVKYVDQNERSSQDNAKNIAIGRIGLPEVKSFWTIENGTKQENDLLEEGRLIVNHWIIERFITIFFDKINEPERKRFWLSHIDIIKNFRIYAPNSVCWSLQQDPRIKGRLFNLHVKKITANTYKDDCALIFEIDNYIIAEFSNTGGIYVYKKQDAPRSCFVQEISSVANLKRPSIGKLVDSEGGFYSMSSQGTMRHQGYWQQRMNMWLRRFVTKEQLTLW